MSEDKKNVLEYIHERAENITRYSDELRKNLVLVHNAMPSVGIEVIDSLVLYETPDFEYVWAFDNDGLWFAGREDGITIRNYDGSIPEFYNISGAPRTLLMQAVKRLPGFLEVILERLKDTEKTIKEASDASKLISDIVTALKGL